MTVMPSSSDVADKAVSTDDAACDGSGGGVAAGGGGVGPMLETARLEAVLAALVENKVEAMKHDSALEAQQKKQQQQRKRAGSVPVSPTNRRRSRLASSSTLSSDHHHHHHHHHHHGKHHHHHHHQQQQHHHGDKRGRRHRHRRHDSAPCGDYIEDPHKHRHGSREKSRSVDSPSRHHQHQHQHRDRTRRHSRAHHPHPRPPHRHPSDDDAAAALQQIEAPHRDPRFELLGLDNADAIRLEPTRQALSDTHEYASARIHQSACYISRSAAQLKSHYDEDDYLTLQYADEIDDEDDSLSLDLEAAACTATSDGRAVATAVATSNNNTEQQQQQQPPVGRRPPRRKRKRRKRRRSIVDVEGVELEMDDPDDLPPRARWTIVATACLLLVMSLLLVGVTLRMAPIIDEMGDGRRASTCKRPSTSSISGQQQQSSSNHQRTRRASTAHRRDSVRPTRSPSSGGQPLTPTSLEALQTIHGQKKKHSRQESFGEDLEKNDHRETGVEADERSPRQRRIATILLGTFLFILAASVLAVVVTLTHSSFYQPPIGSRELQEHRANV